MKNKKIKKLLSAALCIAVLVSSITGASFYAKAATSTYTSGGLTCVLDNDTGVFTVSVKDGGNGRGDDYTSDIWSRAPWYINRSSIKSVVIQDGVIQIGAYWFYDCTNLTSVSFADTVDTVGDCCFKNCTALTGVEFPRNCFWYYKEIFSGCSNLKWAILPNGNKTDNYSTKIPDGLFSGCSSLEQVYVGAEHTQLDANVFSGCNNLKTVIWDSGTMTAAGSNALNGVSGNCAFRDNNVTSSLQNWCSSNNLGYSGSLSGDCNSNLSYNFSTDDFKLSFSNSGNMNSIPWQSENYNYLIKDISFNDVNGSYTIANNAFENCFNLNTVIFNNETASGTLEIGDYAFYNCVNSTYWLNLPSNVTGVGENAFNNTNFNYVTLESPSSTYEANAFGKTDYARFYGVPNENAKSFFKAGKDNGYNWYYYCLNDQHTIIDTVIPPTCTQQGYTIHSCANCLDAGETTDSYTNALGHDYSKATSTGNGFFTYICSRCGDNNLKVNAIYLLSLFRNAISTDENTAPYKQSNYDSQFDVYKDGYINAKDFFLIDNESKMLDVTGKETFINTNQKYQTIEGFGASGAWWAQDIGRWSEDKIDVVTELLYGDTGAGLDIYRYNLGGGSNGDTHIADWRRSAEDFLDENSDINDASTYDWSADEAAQKVLASAQKANSDLKVTLFSNSAPTVITKNGFGYCSNGVSSNLDESNYQAFANYVVNCAEHFIDQGYNVTCVSPVNEPEWDWAADSYGNAGQEGARFEYEPLRNFYNNYMVPTLQNSSLNGKVELSVWECAQLNHSSHWDNYLPYMFSSEEAVWGFIGNDYASYNNNIRSYCNALDTHSYWASTSDREQAASDISGSDYSAIQKVKCTEYCQMTNDQNTNVLGHIQAEGGNTNGMTIDYALALADIMHQDLTILNAVEWDWWVACAGGVYPDGLIYVDYNNPDDIQVSKRLWAMGNFARFIQEGAVRVEVTTGSNFGANLTTETTYPWVNGSSSGVDKHSYIEQTAYQNPDGSIVVVYINNSDTDEFTTFGNSYDNIETYVTDENRDLEKYQSCSTQNSIIHIPAKSITTVVLK